MKTFFVRKVHSISPEEIPGRFTFEIPVGGMYYFTQDEENLYLYVEGSTEASLESVEAIMVTEGEEIPAGYTTEFVALLGYGVFEEDQTEADAEPIWAIVAVKNKPAAKVPLPASSEWKKKF